MREHSKLSTRKPDPFHEIHTQILAEIRPDAKEITLLREISEKILSVLRNDGISAMLVGSVARKTWISGDRDLDIFMLFPPDLSREELEVQGMTAARSVAERFSAKTSEKYAEHPYLNMVISDLGAPDVSLDIDLVPCYAVSSASHIQSAVDRTPFHTRYMQERITPYVDDVLLLKQFTKAAGVYGSDLMTEGFSGYLCEILVLAYKGFIPLLHAVMEWKLGFALDIEHHQAERFGAPLIVIDPVDPKRNVSASVSSTRLLEFIEYATGYLTSPSCAFFETYPVPPLTQNELKELCEKRGTKIWCMVFSSPSATPDTIVPQLRKTRESLVQLLIRHDFRLVRHAEWMGTDTCILLFELMEDELSACRRHIGPPVTSREHAKRFFEKYLDKAACLSGPYIQDGRYVVEVERSFQRFTDLMHSSEPFSVALGKQIKIAMKNGFTLCTPVEAYTPESAPFFSEYLHYSSPLTHLQRKNG
jgi:tRNA nucleotidyltransferase (CCA-adding enzyme)